MTDLLSPDTGLPLHPEHRERPARHENDDHPARAEAPTPRGGATAAEEPEADEVVVRRNGRVSVVLAALSALLAAAFFARAVTQPGEVLDWVFCAVLTAITWAHVFSFLDARVPLLVADSHGVRIRLGRTWRGMAWTDLEEVEHTPRRGLLQDGRVVLLPRDADAELARLGSAARRHARLSERLHGAPFALPLGLTTRVLGAPSAELTSALAALAEDRCAVVEAVRRTGSEPEAGAEGEPEPGFEDEDEGLSDAELPQVADPEPTAPEPAAAVVASPTPSPMREVRPAVRADVQHDWEVDTEFLDVPAASSPTSTFVIDDLAALEAVEPVIGPQLKAARQRLRLSVDQLAERTRIRPHVIEAIEIDDFAPCGGDFYARGHLRTLARVLGVDVAPLLATYDDRYADAPIDPRRVFEAELATGRHGPIRGVKGGPNWSVIVAAVMTVVLAWSVARLMMDNPATVSPSSPSLAEGSAGLTSGRSAAAPVPVVISAAGGGAQVVVRDGAGKVVFNDSLAFGQSRTLRVSPPVRIQSSDGSLEVTVDGRDHGPIGSTGEQAQDVFTGG